MLIGEAAADDRPRLRPFRHRIDAARETRAPRASTVLGTVPDVREHARERARTVG